MNFELNEQQLSIQKMARDFTEKKVAPKVLERDETREYDVNLYKDLCDMGFIGLPYAKEYGGQGLGYMEYALAVEEISKVDPSLGVSFSVATSLYGGSLYFSEATDEQLKRFMPPVLRDGHLGSFGLTEPTAGSDVSGMLTFAENDFTYKMSILKSADEAGTACNGFTYSYKAIAGVGHFLHTYMGDGNPLPTFTGEPERASIPNDIDAWTKEIWENLNEQNKISIYVRFTDLKTGAVENRMINKNV